jgi:DNA-binding response OmpR family regulator
MRANKPNLTGCHVLLVEDEYFIADDFCRALEACGASVVGPVPSLDEALPLAEAESLTCAVLDIDLRGESGLKVAEVLRRRNVPFIYSTGYHGAMVPEALKGAAHLEKPFRVENLLHAVDKVYRQSRE